MSNRFQRPPEKNSESLSFHPRNISASISVNTRRNTRLSAGFHDVSENKPEKEKNVCFQRRVVNEPDGCLLLSHFTSALFLIKLLIMLVQSGMRG